MDNEPVQQLLFSFSASGIKTQGKKGGTKKKKEYMRINTRGVGWWLDLKEVFQTLEMWRKLISRRWESSRGFDGDSFDACSQRHKHTLCSRTEHPNLHTRKSSFSSEGSKGLAETIGIFHDSSACEGEAFRGGGTNGSEPAGSEPRRRGDDDAVKRGFGATSQDVCLVGPASLHPRADKRKKPLSLFQIFFYAQLSEWNMTRWRDGI